MQVLFFYANCNCYFMFISSHYFEVIKKKLKFNLNLFFIFYLVIKCVLADFGHAIRSEDISIDTQKGTFGFWPRDFFESGELQIY